MPRLTLEERFWSKVEVRGPDECWPWLGEINHNGYGRCPAGRRKVAAHRIAYELAVGPIPPEHDVDHVAARGCTRRDCCNPGHLEPVTHVENVRRGEGGRKNRVKTHCPKGHPYSGDNLRFEAGGRRRCRTCARAAYERWRARQ